MRSWERSEKTLTTTCFLAWSASVLLLAGSHVLPFVPTTPIITLVGFAYVAFFYTRTTSTPELLKPLRPSLWNPAAPASPAHPATTGCASFDDSGERPSFDERPSSLDAVEHDPPASYEDNNPTRRENTTRRHSTSHPALHRTPKDMASPFAPNLEIFLSTTRCDVTRDASSFPHSAQARWVRSVQSV